MNDTPDGEPRDDGGAEDNLEPESGDELDDAVVAADDTGLLAGERLITNAELLEGNPDLRPGGDV
ncbi:MAG: hypothetical protein JOZ24_08530 [Candidatus Eremiobacteraeota bacterium]|nr:hypothetical protein [Candidatus Eremiobacteraeota bacterium]